MATKPTAAKGSLQKFTAVKSVPPHVERAAAGLAAAVTVKKPDTPQLRGPEPPVKGSDRLSEMIKNELPRNQALADKFKSSPVLSTVKTGAKMEGKRATVVRTVADHEAPKPRVMNPVPLPPAKSEAQAAHNKRARKAFTVVRNKPASRVVLSVGVRPSDLANGITTPARGLIKTSTQPYKPGTGLNAARAVPKLQASVLSSSPAQPAAEISPELPPVVTTLPVVDVDGTVKNNPLSSSGEGFGRLAFLAGAVFVAYLVLGKAA